MINVISNDKAEAFQAEIHLRKEAQLRHLNPDGAFHARHTLEPVRRRLNSRAQLEFSKGQTIEPHDRAAASSEGNGGGTGGGWDLESTLLRPESSERKVT